jgi:hypothetical protein
MRRPLTLVLALSGACLETGHASLRVTAVRADASQSRASDTGTEPLDPAALAGQEAGETAARRLAPIKDSSATANLCSNFSVDCFEDATCVECVLLGSITSDMATPGRCSDARGAFMNAYNGSTSLSRNLKCEPYNTNTALGSYLECVWKSGPCGMNSARALRAGGTALAGVAVGVMLVL